MKHRGCVAIAFWGDVAAASRFCYAFPSHKRGASPHRAVAPGCWYSFSYDIWYGRNNGWGESARPGAEINAACLASLLRKILVGDFSWCQDRRGEFGNQSHRIAPRILYKV